MFAVGSAGTEPARPANPKCVYRAVSFGSECRISSCRADSSTADRPIVVPKVCRRAWKSGKRPVKGRLESSVNLVA